VIPITCEPIEHKRRPNTPYAALFSLPYCVAVSVLRGRAALEDFEEDRLGDPAVLALAAKVRCTGVASSRFPQYLHGAARVRLSGGRTAGREEPVNWGNPENPMRREDVEAKFRRNASRALSAAKGEAIVAAVAGLEAAPGASALVAALKE
ncbi:MAG: MmgE/PrpD family protein, partial [Candidatus Tectomicrobia bacterium]|nr:MmgE/PrpD family protein [Candidatus Tectomicrobia bacterium]